MVPKCSQVHHHFLCAHMRSKRAPAKPDAVKLDEAKQKERVFVINWSWTQSSPGGSTPPHWGMWIFTFLASATPPPPTPEDQKCSNKSFILGVGAGARARGRARAGARKRARARTRGRALARALGIVLGSLWDHHFGIILASFWDHFGTNLRLF